MGADDDDKYYTERVGRWIRESIAAVNDQAFWLQLHAQHDSRATISHATRAEQKNNSMVNLVAHIVPSVIDHMEALLDEDLAACWLVALKHTPEDAHSDLLQEIVCTCGGVVCNLIRRVQLPCQEFPRLFVWLTTVAQGQQSDFITDVCGHLCELMRSAPDTVDNFTSKVWTWFHAELQHCAETGVVPYNLHALMADVADAWVVDVQYAEGCNGVLKKVVTRDPCTLHKSSMDLHTHHHEAPAWLNFARKEQVYGSLITH